MIEPIRQAYTIQVQLSLERGNDPDTSIALFPLGFKETAPILPSERLTLRE